MSRMTYDTNPDRAYLEKLYHLVIIHPGNNITVDSYSSTEARLDGLRAKAEELLIDIPEDLIGPNLEDDLADIIESKLIERSTHTAGAGHVEVSLIDAFLEDDGTTWHGSLT